MSSVYAAEAGRVRCRWEPTVGYFLPVCVGATWPARNRSAPHALDRGVARTAAWHGEVVSIHIAPKAEDPMRSVQTVRAIAGKGLEGDRYFKASGTYSDRPGPAREITLIESEAIEAMARDNELVISPGEARRHVITRGVPLNHLVGREFVVGGVRLPGIRVCEPCSHPEGLTR